MQQVYVDGDVMYFVERTPFVPVRYRHVKRGTVYTVISDDEVHLNEFSYEGSVHEFPWQGRMLSCELEFSGGAPDDTGRPSRYAGKITVYVGEDGRGWIRPSFEFHDGRFERIEE